MRPLPSSTSDFDIIVPELVLVLETELDDADRFISRPFTPSTALKKLAEPVVIVREIASRVGASCCSSLSSWMPSERRSVISAIALGFSLHGCLWAGSRINKDMGVGKRGVPWLDNVE